PIMLFTSPDGLSRLKAAIGVIQVTSEGFSLRYPITEGKGTTLGYLDTEGNNQPGYDLTLQFFDPAAYGYPRIWGSIPTADASTGFGWVKTPAFSNRDPV